MSKQINTSDPLQTGYSNKYFNGKGSGKNGSKKKTFETYVDERYIDARKNGYRDPYDQVSDEKVNSNVAEPTYGILSEEIYNNVGAIRFTPRSDEEERTIMLLRRGDSFVRNHFHTTTMKTQKAGPSELDLMYLVDENGNIDKKTSLTGDDYRPYAHSFDKDDNNFRFVIAVKRTQTGMEWSDLEDRSFDVRLSRLRMTVDQIVCENGQKGFRVTSSPNDRIIEEAEFDCEGNPRSVSRTNLESRVVKTVEFNSDGEAIATNTRELTEDEEENRRSFVYNLAREVLKDITTDEIDDAGEAMHGDARRLVRQAHRH